MEFAILKTANGLPVTLVDLTSLSLQQGTGANGSIIAAIIPEKDQTVFIKMTGPTELLAGQKKALETICRSFHRKEGAS